MEPSAGVNSCSEAWQGSGSRPQGEAVGSERPGLVWAATSCPIAATASGEGPSQERRQQPPPHFPACCGGRCCFQNDGLLSGSGSCILLSLRGSSWKVRLSTVL